MGADRVFFQDNSESAISGVDNFLTFHARLKRCVEVVGSIKEVYEIA